MAEPAIVTQLTPQLMIRFDTGPKEMPALRLASYAPVQGDRIAVIELGARLLVLGKTL